MDTDSFILSIKTNNLLKDLEYFKHDFDFSELDKDHPLFDTTNKKVIGKMKIETSPIIEIDEFIALRSKSYAYSFSGSTEKSKQKGIQKSPKKETYINSLFNSETTTGINYSIRSNKHNLTVEKQEKLCLNPFDDKRLYLTPTKSLPWDKKHIQSGDCSCLLCIKFIGLYYKELTQNKTDEEIYYNVWYWKQFLNHEKMLKLISNRAHLL